MKKLLSILLLAVSCLTAQAEETTNVLEYTAPEWNDYPITFSQSDDSKWSVSGSKINYYYGSEAPSTLTAKVTVGNDATLCYSVSGTISDLSMKLIIDGKEVRSWDKARLEIQRSYYQTLNPGEHTIQWVVQGYTNSIEFGLRDVGIETTPWITVKLLEPGSLGTEILYNVDHLKDVRCLKIIGSMNDDDWAKINMMEGNLFALDLSETDIKEITDRTFFGISKCPYLYSVKLPEGLKRIGDSAFSSVYGLTEINFPATLESIGDNAFNNTAITSAMLPESCTELGSDAFYGCNLLENVSLSNSLKTIGDRTFKNCYNLKTFKLPEKLETIGYAAFSMCYLIAFDFPESLRTIGSSAFYYTNQLGEKSKLILPKNITSIGDDAFNMSSYTYADMPVSFYTLKYGTNILPGSITTIRLNSPTVVEYPDRSNKIISDAVLANVTLQVPSFLVNSYKLDDYWYNFGKIEGFSTSEIDEWILNGDLVLGARDRFEGIPSIIINENGSLKINGTDGMTVDNLDFKIDPNNNIYGRMFSNADDVIVNGRLQTEFFAGTSNRWYFMSMPYNVKVSDITYTTNAPKRAIRYYDGANRAENGAVGSWKNFEEDDIIPAGTGFIFQASESGWWNIPSQEDESKQFLTSNNMFVKALEENPSDNASNRGWNLVGNPYQCWYNIHKLNFTAPITVRDIKNNTYAAYSVIDDDYAIAPNQAFFVQCPEGINEISFPLDGRQMTSVITSQASAKPKTSVSNTKQRVLIDLNISNGKFFDRTRIVFNDAATTDYDSDCDAGKFFSESQDVPQIYSYDTKGNMYAINERPEGNSNVKLGFIAPKDGDFTISLARDNAGNVMLKDNETGSTVNLSAQAYSFTSNAGTYDKRFELYLAGGVTGLDKTTASGQAVSINASNGRIEVYGSRTNVEVYNISGAKAGSANVSGSHTFILPAGVYVVKAGGKSLKVVVP